MFKKHTYRRYTLTEYAHLYLCMFLSSFATPLQTCCHLEQMWFSHNESDDKLSNFLNIQSIEMKYNENSRNISKCLFHQLSHP